MPQRFIFAAFLAVILTAGSASAQDRSLPGAADLRVSYAPIVQHVSPAVVNVYAAKVVQNRNPLFDDPIFRRFFGVPGGGSQVQRSLGSGVIVDASGLVVTNVHVIEGADEVKVSLADKREFEATLVLKDPRSDLAILRIKDAHERFPFLEFANSDALQVGDVVLAVGNPFGVGQTVTHGIISALARTQVGITDYQFFIQTDAAINPGNSGGALVTTDGRLAGINTAIYSRTGGSIGIGFAIPANLARRVVEGVEGGKGVQLSWIGATGQPVTSDIATSLGLAKPGGVLIKDIYPGGPLANAGGRSGDVVASVDGAAVDDMQSLNYRIATHRPGEVVKVHVESGKSARDANVTLALPPENPPREARTISGRNPLGGACSLSNSSHRPKRIIEKIGVGR